MPERVPDDVGVTDLDCEIVGVLDGVLDGLTVLERVCVIVGVTVLVSEIVGVLEGVPEADGVGVPD